MADVAPDHWAAEFIDGLVALGIVDGYPIGGGAFEFRPENPITRAEMAKLLVVTKGLELIDDYDGSRFADWDSVADWAKPYIAAAVEDGVMVGSNEGDGIYILADMFINREQMIAMAVRSLGADITEGAELLAADADSVSGWARDFIAFAIENDMINMDGSLNVRPLDEATRAEAAMVLFKLIQYLDEGGMVQGAGSAGSVGAAPGSGEGGGDGAQNNGDGDGDGDGSGFEDWEQNGDDDYVPRRFRDEEDEEQYHSGVTEYVDEDGVTRYLDESGAIINAAP